MTCALGRMADTGAQTLERDSILDLAKAQARVGHRVSLTGDLNPVTILWQGSPANVERLAHEAIDQTACGGGFILGSGYEAVPATPEATLKAMIAVARRRG